MLLTPLQQFNRRRERQRITGLTAKGGGGGGVNRALWVDSAPDHNKGSINRTPKNQPRNFQGFRGGGPHSEIGLN